VLSPASSYRQCITFVAGQAVHVIDAVPSSLAGRPLVGPFRENGSGAMETLGNPFDSRLLLDQQEVECDGVEISSSRGDRGVAAARRSSLGAGLVNVPGIAALGVDLRNLPSSACFADALG